MNDNATRKKLSAKQLKAIEGLLTHRDSQAAADHAGVNRGTIYRWRKDEDFNQALKQAETEAIATLGRELITLGSKATSAVEAVLDSGESTPAQKLRASEIILNNILRLKELVDFEERLTKLEENYEQVKNQA